MPDSPSNDEQRQDMSDMPDHQRSQRWWSYVMLATVVIGSLVLFLFGSRLLVRKQPIAKNQSVYDYRPGTEDGGAGPVRPIGSQAPDFAIPTLASYLLENPRTPELQSLSAFRGNMPVVLILSGYT